MAARVSQAMVEVLLQPTSAQVDALVSQVMVEALVSIQQVTVGARVSQVMVEVLVSTRARAGDGTSGHWFRDLNGDEVTELYEELV